MSERIQKPHLPYRQEVESVVGGVLKRCHPLGTLATIYYKEAPNLIAKTVDGNTPAHLNRLFRTSHFSDETFRGILEAMAQWSNFDAQVAESLVAETVPCLMACTSFLKLENVKSSMNIGWQLLAKQVGEGKVSLMSPLCPPYDYVVTSNGHLKHATGSLQPKIGERFETVAKTLGRAFKPLTIKGVEVTWEFWTYSGETLNLDDVVDLGADVIQHYQRPEEIFSNLQAAYRDLRYQATHHMSEFGVVAKTVSIENVIGPVIHQTTEEFMTSFPKSRNGIHPPEEPEIDKWLDDRFGVKAGWLIFFIQEEKRYRQKQGGLIGDGSDPIVKSALREGLLYLGMTRWADQNGTLIIGLETTPEYMVGSLRHSHAPVIMGAAFDPKKPENPLNVRQPFNLPVRL